MINAITSRCAGLIRAPTVTECSQTERSADDAGE